MAFVFVSYERHCVEVSLAGVVRGTQLVEAAYRQLGLDKDGVALYRVQLSRTVGGVREPILP